MIFTNLASPEAAASVADDPRAWMHWVQHTAPVLRALGRQTDRVLDDTEPDFERLPASAIRGKANSKIDWAISLGANGGMPTGETPAKYSFDINLAPNCTKDFVVFMIAATPGATQANIVAFNNLYNGTGPGQQTCGGTQATTMWAYRVGTGPNYLSPVLSLDGKKVAFINSGTTRATYDVLTWVAGQGSSPTAPMQPGTGGSSLTALDYTNVTNGGCTASGASDSNSSPFIDYKNNVVYVGADNGKLYRIKNAFTAPAVDYCITVAANVALTSPVYDSFSKKVFVSDGRSVFGFTPGATSFTAAGSVQIAGTAGSIVLSPMVDGFNGRVYVFSGNNLTNTNTIVSQMPTSLASHVDTPLGPSFSGQYILDGDFDNKYYNNGPATGTLYACGTQTGANTKPALYSISFAANGLMNTAPVMNGNRNINAQPSNPASVCSPLLTFFDGTTDRLFVGTGTINATNGSNLVTMWNVTNRLTNTAALPTASATNYIGGTSAFSIDNNSISVPQAASIYFGTLARSGSAPCGNNYCAVKLTQSNLR